MIRLVTLAALLALPGCVALPPAAWVAIGAGAGAAGAAFRLDTVAACWLIGREGIQEARSVSAVCVQPAIAPAP